MDIENISDVLDKLRWEFPKDSQDFFVVDFPTFPNHKLGINNKNELLVLLSSKPNSAGKPHSVKLDLIEVVYDKLCYISNNDESTYEERFTVLKFKSLDPHLQLYFLRICELIIGNLNPRPCLNEINIEVERLLNIFGKSTSPSKRTIQGLFGELVLIKSSSNKEKLISSWHASYKDVFDFDLNSNLIEVKSSSTNQRIHTFSHKQLLDYSNKPSIYICSIILLNSGNGHSLLDLANEIERDIKKEEYIIKLYNIISETLGNLITDLDSFRFNLEYAINSMAFFSVKDVPKINNDSIPDSISNLTYEVNLDLIPPTLDLVDII